MEKPLRLRIVFSDRKILNKAQRSEGLKHSWLLLKPNMTKISDLECHLQKSFNLEKNCPNGVVLYVDGFVLPPFESTCVLKDSDIISVRKKDMTLVDAIEVGDKPLAITKAGENSDGQKRKTGKDLCMFNENDTHKDTPLKSKKKRKNSDEIPIPKKKKLKTNSNKPTTEEEDENITEEVAGIRSRKKSSNRSSEKIVNPLPTEKRKTQVEVVINGYTVEPRANGSVTKTQSRNARRKEEKRQWLREIKAQKKENYRNDFASDGVIKESLEQQEREQNIEIGKENVPRMPLGGQWQLQEKMGTHQWSSHANKKGPNYQREKAVSHWDHANGFKDQSNSINVTVTKWNDGKNKICQKYGKDNLRNQNHANGYNNEHSNRMEKTSNGWNNANGSSGQKRAKEKNMSSWNHANGAEKKVSKWNDASNYIEQCDGTTGTWNDADGYNDLSNGKAVSLNEKAGSNPIDFESLFPLTRIPQVGDLLAYRLIEMSPSWCPTITSFRVGEVTSYNYLTLSIILVPVPEYPIFSDDMHQTKSSQYKEDGSLQIHYPSLIDVRLLKGIVLLETSSESSERGTNSQKATPVNKWELGLVNSNSNDTDKAPQPTENGNWGRPTWDQIKQTINEKKAEHEEKKKSDGWGEWTSKKSASSTSWKNARSEWNANSCAPNTWDQQRAMRGRGAGPSHARGGRGRGDYKQPFRKW